MEFSLTGFIIAIAIFAPNLFMVVFPPLNVPSGLKDAGIVFTVLERVGQISCLVLLAISKSNFDNRSFDIWFILSGICIVAYYGLWIRYAIAGRDFALLFKFYALPIPMAIVPILAFAFIAIWGKSIRMGLAAVVFAVGHIVNSWNTYSLIT